MNLGSGWESGMLTMTASSTQILRWIVSALTFILTFTLAIFIMILLSLRLMVLLIFKGILTYLPYACQMPSRILLARDALSVDGEKMHSGNKDPTRMFSRRLMSLFYPISIVREN